jgi:energy-coupling factor transporter ATP-binding protein EcfA2
MKITKVSLKDFRGFPGSTDYIFDLDEGKNLLLYGENGSGKTSLFEALKGLFNHRSPTKFDNKITNVFQPTDEGFVRVDLSSGTPADYGWKFDEFPSGQASETQFLDIARRAVFLDYRDLLATHYVHRNNDYIDVFPLLLETLIPDIDLGGGSTFRDLWHIINQPAAQAPSFFQNVKQVWLPNLHSLLNSILIVTPPQTNSLTYAANALLAKLSPGIQISFNVTREKFKSWEKFRALKNFGFIVKLNVTYAGYTPPHPSHFLNEARLTAIALSIFLAAAKLSRPAAANQETLRLLVLDDVLISLDFANRLPLLKLLEADFSDWQVFIFTHDLTWFEMARQQVKENKWAICELICERRDGEPFERPVLRQGGTIGFLKRARQHLASGDKRAAAVYARAAFEEKIRAFCNDKSIPIPFKNNPSQIDGEAFLSAAEKRIKSEGHWSEFGSHFIRLRMVRKVILNPLSHSNLSNLVSSEIFDAIEAIEGLKLSTPEAHPSTDECRSLLSEVLGYAINDVAKRVGITLPVPEEDEISSAITLIDRLSFDKENAKPSIQIARELAAGEETPENKFQLASHLRAAFEHSLIVFVLRKTCAVPFSKDWASVSTVKLWAAAKSHAKLLASQALPFVTAVETDDFKNILLEPLEPVKLQLITWDKLRAILNTLEATAPEVTYTFQTKLDVLAK